MQPVKIYLIAGEPSGDLLASRLMRALRQKTTVEFMGVGGETMATEGLTSLYDIKDLAVMGFWEVVPSIPKILSLVKETLDDIEKQKPSIVVTVDSWSFSKQIHLGMIKRGIKIPHIHYVAPQVWAWKAKRAKQIKNWVDHLLMLLPFEEKYFKPHGVPYTYVGHPVIEGGADKGDEVRFRKNHSVSSRALVMSVLPGSRKTEVKRLLPIFKQVVDRMRQKYPSLVVVIPTVATVADLVKKETSSWSVPTIIVQGERERYDAFAASRVALAASGTVSLELAMSGTPHLITYRLSPVSAWIARRVLKVRYVNLINILADRMIIPELLQESCNPNAIVSKLEELMGRSGQLQQRQAAVQLRKLGKEDGQTPSQKAADEILNIIKNDTK